MLNLDRVMGGIGILIFAYLLFNARNVGEVLSSGASAGSKLITSLQGR